MPERYLFGGRDANKDGCISHFSLIGCEIQEWEMHYISAQFIVNFTILALPIQCNAIYIANIAYTILYK